MKLSSGNSFSLDKAKSLFFLSFLFFFFFCKELTNTRHYLVNINNIGFGDCKWVIVQE